MDSRKLMYKSTNPVNPTSTTSIRLLVHCRLHSSHRFSVQLVQVHCSLCSPVDRFPRRSRTWSLQPKPWRPPVHKSQRIPFLGQVLLHRLSPCRHAVWTSLAGERSTPSQWCRRCILPGRSVLQHRPTPGEGHRFVLIFLPYRDRGRVCRGRFNGLSWDSP